jgi:DNA-binding PadR family transcriptional regulator
MSASYGLLGILSAGPNYGYELKRLYDYYFANGKTLAFGQVYSTLSRLKRDGHVETETLEQAKGPERIKYAITPSGRTELERWLTLPENTHPKMQSILFTKVISAILLDKNPHTYLDAQRSAHLERMRQLTDIRRHGDIAAALRADYEIFHLEADLRWIDLTSARLQKLIKEVRS